jgi:osmoprotectant transport system ATP-binding protein
VTPDQPPADSLPPAPEGGDFRPRQTPAQGDPVLAAASLWKSYGTVRALEDVSLVLHRGETVALVGESGSGKTTLLRVFNALVRPDDGTVRVSGLLMDEEDPVALRRRIGYVPQEGGLLPHWTVLRNASLVPGLLKLPDAEALARSALERVGLDPETFGPRYPRTLSGGQRQRVALARALAADPGVVLLDEPFGALDALSRSEILDVFEDVLESPGVSALLVTHDLQVAQRLANRIAVLKAGRILQCAPVKELLENPADPYVAALLERGGVVRGVPAGHRQGGDR